MSDLTPKGFSNGKYVDRFLLRDKLYEEDAITMGGMAILNNFHAADVVPVVRCKFCRSQRWCKFAQYLGNDGFCSQGEYATNNGARMDGDEE